MLKKIIFIVLILLLNLSLKSQIQDNTLPFSFSNEIKLDIPQIILPKINTNILLDEDSKNVFFKPFRFAHIFDVDINSDKDGIWYENDSLNIWFLSIKTENAFSISLMFENFVFEDSQKLYCYNKEKTFLIGAFTNVNNNIFKVLQTQYVSGDEIIIEYCESKKQKTKNQIKISQVAHDYRNILKTVKTSGECEIDINCTEGADWQIDKKSVLKYTYNSHSKAYLCTATMVGNTQQNEIPYILTAEHCVRNQDAANSMIFYFNYEAKNCNGYENLNSQTLNGAILKATGKTLDFTLLQLNSIPPAEYEPYYAGWTNEDFPNSGVVCIHHPSGDIKKISIDKDIPQTGNFGSDYDVNTHWQIAKWDLGTTEGGSSGSPIFDSKHHIIGTLTGGDANCENSVNDYFQKFSIAWDSYDSQYQQLNYWLNPNNINIEFLNGYNPYTGMFLNRVQSLYAELDNNIVDLNWDFPLKNENKNLPEKFYLYRDLVKIAEINASDNLIYKDVLEKDGKFTYHITAIYDGIESYPSNQVSIYKNYVEEIIKKPNIIIYPNPTDRFLYIELNDTIVSQNIKLYDIFGKQIKNYDITNQNNILLDLEFLQSGIYIFKFEGKNFNEVQRIFKLQKK